MRSLRLSGYEQYRKSVWKSYAEYKALLRLSDDEMKTLYYVVESRATDIIDSLCECFKDDNILRNKDSWAIFNAKAKLSTIKDSEIYIWFDDFTIEEYSKLTNVESREFPAFFYLYCKGEALTSNQKRLVTEVISSYIS